MTTVQGFNYPCWSTLHTDTLRFCLLMLFDTGQDEAISVTLMETLKTFSKKAIEQIDLIKAVGVLVTLSGMILPLMWPF